MGYVKNCLISYFVILILLGFCVSCNYFDEKPPEEVIKGIILRIIPNTVDFKLKPKRHIRGNTDLRNFYYNNFIITNSFISKKNGRYCVSVNYIVSFEIFPYMDKDPQWVKENYEEVDGRYSFEKKGKFWYGGEGWGKGEEYK